jgi:uncharacterized protein (UPF0335 family)
MDSMEKTVTEGVQHDEWGEIIEPEEHAKFDAPADDDDPEMFPETLTDSPIGHNQGPTLVVVGENGDSLNAAAVARLRTIVEQIERLDDELDMLKTDRKEVMSEAKGEGFDTKIIQKVVALRRKGKAKAAEEAALISLYQDAIEGLPG